jgi:hypothetical protein
MADDDAQTGGMIALIPDTPGAFTVPGGDPAGQIHCTLVFLGDDVTTLDEGTLEKLKARVMQLAADNGPVEGKIMGPAIWNRNSDKFKPSTNTTLTADYPLVGIHEYAEDIGRAVLGDGRFPEQHRPWNPHICAGYSLPEDVLPKASGTVRFSKVRLALAGKDYDFPLSGWRGDEIGMEPRRYAGKGTMTMTDTITKPAEPEITVDGAELKLYFPCLAIEGMPTADGRYIEPGSLTTRALPISVLAQTVNPGSEGGHAKAEVMGKLDEAWKIPGPEFISKQTGEPLPEGTFVWQGRGTGDPESVGGKLAAKGYLTGNSIDLSEVDFTDDVLFNEDGTEEHRTSVNKGVIAATTLCAIPAFPDAYVEINGEAPVMLADDGAVVPESERTLENLIKYLEGKGLEAVTASSFRAVELGDDCLPCEALETEELAGKPFAKGVATGLPITDGKSLAKAIAGASSLKGPAAAAARKKIIAAAKKLKMEGKIPAAWKGDGSVTAVTSSGVSDIPALRTFQDPELDGPTPLHIDYDTREIYGHIATWKSCHLGITRKCTPPPRSGTDYSHFLVGAMRVKDGDEIRTVAVGHLTMDTGHANLSMSATDTTRHYDHTGFAAADLAAGEDAHGIWVHGLVRPDLTREQMDKLAASPPSGDWRPVNGGLEMVAVLLVNTPGYVVPRARVASVNGGEPELVALVAAGALKPESAFVNGIDVDRLADALTDKVAARLGDLLGQWARSPVTEPDAVTVQAAALRIELGRMDALEALQVVTPFETAPRRR